MRIDLIDEMFKLEATHWWHVAKRRLIIRLLNRYLEEDKTRLRHLDIGCGTGMMLWELSGCQLNIGVDLSSPALNHCQSRGLANVAVADLNHRLPFKSESFEIITMLDVLEHLDNDLFALQEIWRVLKPQGLFILTAPAHPSLWTYWDEILGHKRRYREADLKNSLQASGFKLLKFSFFYLYLLPFAVIFRIIKSFLPESFRKQSDFINLPKPLNQLLIQLAALETKVIEKRSLPAGLSLVCVLRKT